MKASRRNIPNPSHLTCDEILTDGEKAIAYFENLIEECDWMNKQEKIDAHGHTDSIRNLINRFRSIKTLSIPNPSRFNPTPTYNQLADQLYQNTVWKDPHDKREEKGIKAIMAIILEIRDLTKGEKE